MPKFTLFENPEKNLKAAGFKDEAHFSDVLKSDILSGIEEIVGVDFDPNPIREGDGGGSNRADLVCTVTESTENGEHKSTVIIENELGKSKHGHLGQCITYGSNRSAKIVIWICETFQDHHIKALQWLNEHFKDSVGFYGLEVKAYKHPDSVKIKFETKVKPLYEIFNADEYTQRENKTRQIFEMAQEKFNEISSETSTSRLKMKNYQDCLKTKTIQHYWHYYPNRNHIMTIIKCRAYLGEQKMVETWNALERNKEKIEKKLSGVKWKNAHEDESLDGFKPHLDIPSCDVPKDLEGISDEEIKKIANKLASDMNNAVDVVKELKL